MASPTIVALPPTVESTSSSPVIEPAHKVETVVVQPADNHTGSVVVENVSAASPANTTVVAPTSAAAPPTSIATPAPAAVKMETTQSAPVVMQSVARDGSGEVSRGQKGGRNWDRGYCDWYLMSPEDWLPACFCPCFTYSQVRHFERDPDDQERINTTNADVAVDSLLYGVLACCTGGLGSWLLGAYKRNQLRRKVDIKGEDTEDCLAHCCYCCALTQELHQVRHDREILKHNNAAASASYQAQGSMVYTTKEVTAPAPTH